MASYPWCAETIASGTHPRPYAAYDRWSGLGRPNRPCCAGPDGATVDPVRRERFSPPARDRYVSFPITAMAREDQHLLAPMSRGCWATAYTFPTP